MLGGVHIELTGEDVTECIGGARGLDGGRSGACLQVAGGPPFECRTGLELAMLIARHAGANRGSGKPLRATRIAADIIFNI